MFQRQVSTISRAPACPSCPLVLVSTQGESVLGGPPVFQVQRLQKFQLTEGIQMCGFFRFKKPFFFSFVFLRQMCCMGNYVLSVNIQGASMY